MAWESDKMTRKLLIEDHGVIDGKHLYRLSPFMRVERGNGEVYLEPLPSRTGLHRLAGLYDFAAIEFVRPPAPKRNNDGGALGMTCMFPYNGVRSTQESAA